MVGGQTIVLVNDDEDTIDLLVELLQESGFRAEGFTDGVAALERLTQGEEPCLLILDYRIGKMDGDEFLRRARLAGVTAPAVVMTGMQPRHEDVDTLHQQGVARVLTKPFSVDDISETIQAYGRRGCR
jgi:CheY-like chemotaxis protein